MRADAVLDVVAGSNMDLRPGDDGAGIIAFFVVAALVVVCVLLYRSMRKHLARVTFDAGPTSRSTPPSAPPPTPPPADEPSARSAGSEPA